MSVGCRSLPDAGPEAEQRLLSRYGRRFAAGSVLFRDGDAATEAFLLQEGRVRLIKHAGAIERSLRVVRPGDLFGEGALVKGTLRTSTALALDDTVALAFDQATFEQVLSTSPEVAARVLSQLIRRLREAEDQIEILMLRDAQSKVVVALLKLGQQQLAQDGRPNGRSGPDPVTPRAFRARRLGRRHREAYRHATARSRLCAHPRGARGTA